MRAVEFTLPLKAGNTLKLAIFSDIHFDSPDCDKVQLKKDLEYCKKEGRYIIINGDLADLILLKDKKRAVNHLMEGADNQLNIKMNELVEFLKPYQSQILFIGRGNHEESILKYHGLDYIQTVTQLLNAGQKHQIQYGNYANFLRFNWLDKRKKSVTHYDIYIHHGAGGSAPATKGMLDFNAIAKGVNADLIVIGHKHNSVVDYSTPIMYVNRDGEIILKNRQCLQTPSYQKGRTIDYNVNFAERFYNHQALSGFGIVDLTPECTDGKYDVKADIKIVNKPRARLGQLQTEKLQLARKIKQKVLEKTQELQK